MANDDDTVGGMEGMCFMCLNDISIPSGFPTIKREPNLESDSSFPHSAYSLQCLSKYLDIDKNMFECNGETQPHSVVMGEKLDLKVELCLECAAINESFSGLYRQLKSIEMEVASCIKTISSKLEQSLDKSLNSQFLPTTKINVLRKKVKQKCAAKLDTLTFHSSPSLVAKVEQNISDYVYFDDISDPDIDIGEVKLAVPFLPSGQDEEELTCSNFLGLEHETHQSYMEVEDGDLSESNSIPHQMSTTSKSGHTDDTKRDSQEEEITKSIIGMGYQHNLEYGVYSQEIQGNLYVVIPPGDVIYATGTGNMVAIRPQLKETSKAILNLAHTIFFVIVYHRYLPSQVGGTMQGARRTEVTKRIFDNTIRPTKKNYAHPSLVIYNCRNFTQYDSNCGHFQFTWGSCVKYAAAKKAVSNAIRRFLGFSDTEKFSSPARKLEFSSDVPGGCELLSIYLMKEFSCGGNVTELPAFHASNEFRRQVDSWTRGILKDEQ